MTDEILKIIMNEIRELNERVLELENKSQEYLMSLKSETETETETLEEQEERRYLRFERNEDYREAYYRKQGWGNFTRKENPYKRRGEF